jgi:prepilin-type N-terminal cleavage/methylation domain-containing protein
MNLSYAAGFSLIEVLVSLLLLAFILLGFDATELFSVRAIRAAYYFEVATTQLNNMVERLQIAAPVNAVEQAELIWNSENKVVLPQGRGQVAGEYPDYQLTIYWGQPQQSCKQNQLGSSGCLSINIHI